MNRYLEKIAKFNPNDFARKYGVEYDNDLNKYVATEAGQKNLKALYERDHLAKGVKTFGALGAATSGAISALKGKGIVGTAKNALIGGLIGSVAGAGLAHMGNKQMDDKTKADIALSRNYWDHFRKGMNKNASDIEMAREYRDDEEHDINKYENAIHKAKNPKLVKAIEHALSQEKIHAEGFRKAISAIRKDK